MNLWLRLLGLLLFHSRARVDLLAVTRVRVRVWPGDLDLNRHVNNGRYLTLADLGRIDWFMRTGVLAFARQQKAWPIVGDATAKFRRDLRLFQRFTIESRMLGWDRKWAFLEHRFLRGGRVLGVVAIRGLFRGPDGPLPPGEFLSSLGIPPQSPALPKWIEEWNASCESMSETLRDEEAARGVH